MFLCHEQEAKEVELEQILQIRLRNVDGWLQVGAPPPLPLVSSQSALRIAGEALKQSGKIMFWRSTRTKMLRLALSCLPTSLALQRLRVWQRSAQCWAAIGETAAVGKVAFLAFCLLLQC